MRKFNVTDGKGKERTMLNENFVVVSDKKIIGTSKVACISQSKEKCEAALIRLTAKFPDHKFSIIPTVDAEKQKLYDY